MANLRFHIADYAVFAVTIVISIGIGIYYALSGGRQRTTSEYLVGGRKMTFIPVAISLMVSFESSIMMLGLPAEAYVYGLQWNWACLGYFVAQIMSIHVVVPLLHPLKLTSAYQYLEYRFKSKLVRRLATILGTLSYIWYMGIVLYGPAVALEAVTEFSLWTSIFVISFVAVIYTAIGGLKAVIWTDVFQALIMFMGMFAVLIKGTMDAGGPVQVWELAEKAGRMNFFNFSLDPRERHTFWNLFVGSIFRGLSFAFNQSTIQRISSTATIADAKRMLYLVAPFFVTTLMAASYKGIVIYSYYQTVQCDPLESRQITNPNQLVPFFVMDIFTSAPGMPGLFLAALFSASLSTLSSGLSSLSASMWADVVHPITGDISEFKATLIAKSSVVLFGLLASLVAILVSRIGGTLTQIAGSLISAFSGPLTGIFFLACFFPRATAKGTCVGVVASFILCVWISMGMNFSGTVKPLPWLPPASTSHCDLSMNVTDQNSTTTTLFPTTAVVIFDNVTSFVTTPSVISKIREARGVEQLYKISYQWLPIVGIFTTVSVGLLTSLLTGMNKPGDVDGRYLISVTDTMRICLPKRFRRLLSSIGPQFQKETCKEPYPGSERKQSVFNMEMTVADVTKDADDVKYDDLLPRVLECDELKQDTAHVDTSKSSAHVDTSESTAHVDTSKSTAHVDTSKSSAHVDTSESTAHVDTSKSTAHVDTSKSSAHVDTSKSTAHVDTSKSSARDGKGQQNAALCEDTQRGV